MQHIQIPEVLPIADGNYVTVPSKAWNAMCTAVNSIVETVNAQSDAISRLFEADTELNTGLKNTDTNLSKIAKILEDVYETLA